MKKAKTKPQCHPNRAHYAKGLCASCYHTQAKKKKTQHKQPTVVTHTHEVIRQVQHEEKQKMPATHENEKAKATEIKDHTGKTGGPYELPKDAPEGSVVSDAGVTEPGQVFGGDGVTPIAEWEEKQKERREKQAELDEKRRQRAVEDSGNVQTTEKHKHG